LLLLLLVDRLLVNNLLLDRLALVDVRCGNSILRDEVLCGLWAVVLGYEQYQEDDERNVGNVVYESSPEEENVVGVKSAVAIVAKLINRAAQPLANVSNYA